MKRINITKEEAEHFLQLMDTAEAAGFKVNGFSVGGCAKSYNREFLEAVRDNGGFSMQIEEPEYHTVVVPASCLGLPEKSYEKSYTGIEKATVRIINALQS